MNEPWWSAEAKRRFELQSYEPRPTIVDPAALRRRAPLGLTTHPDDTVVNSTS